MTERTTSDPSAGDLSFAAARRRVSAHLRRHRQGITVAEAQRLGIDARLLQRMCHHGDLVRTQPGAYVAATATPGYWAHLDHAIRRCYPTTPPERTLVDMAAVLSRCSWSSSSTAPSTTASSTQRSSGSGQGRCGRAAG